jgi:hypothetical protein
VESVDYVSQFLIVDDLFVHVHRHSGLKYIIVFHHIFTGDLGDRRAPGTNAVLGE